MGIRCALIVFLIAALAVTPVVESTQAAVTNHRVVIYAGPAFSPILADTYDSQPDGTAGVDTQLVSDFATTNYGAEYLLGVGQDSASPSTRRALIMFDLSSIPANATINSATFSLWQYNEQATIDRTLRVYRMTQSWLETQATWNIYAGSSPWANVGAYGSPDSETTDIGSRAFTSTEANGEKQWGLTPSAIEEITSGAFVNNGFLVKADSEFKDLHQFYSSDEATQTTQRPKLVIDYTVPTNTPTATDTATATATATDTATATATATDTPTPEPTTTLSSGYQYPLSSGQTLTVRARMSFGEMFNSAALAALLLAFVVYVIYKVIERWS